MSLCLNYSSWINAALIVLWYLMQCIERKDPFFFEFPFQDFTIEDPDNQSKFLHIFHELFEVRNNATTRSPVRILCALIKGTYIDQSRMHNHSGLDRQ